MGDGIECNRCGAGGFVDVHLLGYAGGALLGGEPSVGNVRDVDEAGVGGHFAVPRGSPPGRDRGPADTDLRPWSGTAERTTLRT